MTNAIRFHETGGPEVLRWEAVTLPEPGEGEVQVRQHAVGLNYIDTYYRTGLYKTALPSGLGVEGAGVVEKVGGGVSAFQPGDRVAYAGGPLGAYAEMRNLPADRLVPLPQAISFEQAAAMMLQGLTAQFLIRRTYRIQAGDAILLHAAAGGVGSIVCQWAKALGATVIGTVGSDDKAEYARAHGCDHPVVYTRENFTERVREITGGAGVPVVYDSVGRDTFMGSLDCLRPLGMMVLFGASSGAVPPFEPTVLAQKGSLFLTRPSLFNYSAKREDLLTMADDLFAVVQSGQVRFDIHQRYPLREVAQAHRDLEARKTRGATVLTF